MGRTLASLVAIALVSNSSAVSAPLETQLNPHYTNAGIERTLRTIDNSFDIRQIRLADDASKSPAAEEQNNEVKSALAGLIDYMLESKIDKLDTSFEISGHSFGIRLDLNKSWFNDVYWLADKLKFTSAPTVQWWMETTGQTIGNFPLEKTIGHVSLFAGNYYSEGFNANGVASIARYSNPYSVQNGYKGSELLISLDLSKTNNTAAVPLANSYYAAAIRLIIDHLRRSNIGDGAIWVSDKAIAKFRVAERKLNELPLFGRFTS